MTDVIVEPGHIIIFVENGRAMVVLLVEAFNNTLALKKAENWEELEERAVREVKGQGGSTYQMGEYACSPELAGRARFS